MYTEYLIYGFSEGGLDDIRKVYATFYLLSYWQHLESSHGIAITNCNFLNCKHLGLLLKDLGFAQKKADSQVRWSLLNTVLRRHQAARGKVVEALSTGKSVGSYIDIIENSIDVSDLLLKL